MPDVPFITKLPVHKRTKRGALFDLMGANPDN